MRGPCHDDTWSFTQLRLEVGIGYEDRDTQIQRMNTLREIYIEMSGHFKEPLGDL